MNPQGTAANGGRFNFDDGGTYIGGWEDGKAHGHGICTGPQGRGEYAGAWHYGFELSGVYSWPSGNFYEGQWQNGKLHGLGVEHRQRIIYMGEFSQGYKGRYGVRKSTVNRAHYEGTWSAGYHDGYGTETYVDGGSYQGQWLRGMRHGYGIRKSSSYAMAVKYRSRSHTHSSLNSLRGGRSQEENNEEENKGPGRGGFVLLANSAAPQRRRRSLSERSLAVKRTILSGLRIKKQHSTGDIHARVNTAGSLRSSGSTMSCTSDDSLHRAHLLPSEEEPVDDNVTEIYWGEWKNDNRSGFGVCERSDGLKYHGEWANNAKNGYGITWLKDGTREEGKYRNNVLVASTRRRNALFVRSSRIRERVEASVEAAQRAASIAKQKADIAASRTMTARERAEQAIHIARTAHTDGEMAHRSATHYDPHYSGTSEQITRRQLLMHGGSMNTDASDPMSQSLSRHLSQTHSSNQGSFEQNLSVDLGDPYLTPMGPGPSYLHSNHVGPTTSVGGYHQSSNVPNHVNFPHDVTHPTTSIIIDEAQTPSSSQHPTEALPSPSLLESVVEVADDVSVHKQSTSQTTGGLSAGINQQRSSSRFSLSDDHFDQYVVASTSESNPEQPRIRRNRPSLMRQSDVNDVSMLNRRSTVAATSRARPVVTAEPGPSTSAEENMGSLPNLADLENTGVRLRREDAARLASHRRQEVLRDAEEAALLRQNPLRYLLQPQFRQWIRRWKVPLLLAVVNLTLLFFFYNLLTYQKKDTP